MLHNLLFTLYSLFYIIDDLDNSLTYIYLKFAGVTWLEYCRYDVKHNAMQSINRLDLTFTTKLQLVYP